LLAPNTVDVNAHILSRYISEIVPAVCKPGDDEQHGSSVLCDITALQAISKRIHLGKFVAETKFQVRAPFPAPPPPPSEPVADCEQLVWRWSRRPKRSTAAWC
jgi:chorismate mutase